jgi:hypothetical protein
MLKGESVMTLAAKPASESDRTIRYRRSLFPILALGVFLSGCMTHTGGALGADQTAAEFTFDQYDVVTGSARRQTVLTGFLLDGAVAEIAVLSFDKNDDRRLRLHAFGDATWVPALDATLRPEVLFVDVANIGGRERLVTYGRGRRRRRRRPGGLFAKWQ